MEVVLTSEAILEILRKTTAEAAPPTQHPRLSESLEHAHPENDDEISEVQETRHTEDSTKKDQREGTRDMLRLLSDDGTEFQVPKEVGTLLAELITRVRSMEEQLAHHQRQAASSTRTRSQFQTNGKSGRDILCRHSQLAPENRLVYGK